MAQLKIKTNAELEALSDAELDAYLETVRLDVNSTDDQYVKLDTQITKIKIVRMASVAPTANTPETIKSSEVATVTSQVNIALDTSNSSNVLNHVNPLSDAIIPTFRKMNRGDLTALGSNDMGVFSTYPSVTAKSMRHRPRGGNEYQDSMPRMYIQVAPKAFHTFKAGISDPETLRIYEKMVGSGDGATGGIGYIDFFLSRASHPLQEKMQVTETLADGYVAYFFGSSAPIWSYSGFAMNSYQDDWTMRLFRIFRDLARGTQLARRGLILRLRYDSMLVSGSMINLTWDLNAGTETYCPFSFNLLVKSVQPLYNGLSDPTMILGDSGFMPQGIKIRTANAESAALFFADPVILPEAGQSKVGGTEEENYEETFGVNFEKDVSGTPTDYEAIARETVFSDSLVTNKPMTQAEQFTSLESVKKFDTVWKGPKLSNSKPEPIHW